MLENAALRLRWFSQIVQEHKHHEIYLAAMFGNMINIPNSNPDRSNPHFQQHGNDLRLLQFIEGIAEYVDVIVSSPHPVLFSDEILGGEFVHSEFDVTKDRVTNKAISPTSEIIDPPVIITEPPESNEFVCLDSDCR